MRNNFGHASLMLLLTLAVGAGFVPQSFAAASESGRGSSRRQLGTITGSVRDTRGNRLAGALVKFLRKARAKF